jgi:ferredoxin
MIKKIIIKPGCIACGSCAFICPEVFNVINKVEIFPHANLEKYEEQIKKAVTSCPVGVLKIED